MRVIIQRVKNAQVEVKGEQIANIQAGLLLLVGVEEADEQEDIDWLVAKISKLRIFNDQDGKMNESLLQVGGEVLSISQFTLFASTKKGNRPSFIKAASPAKGEALYNTFNQKLENEMGKPVKTGVFGADMQVALINDGPVTIIMDSKNKE